jgi:hypothetical protein
MTKLFWMLVLVCGVGFAQETEFKFTKEGFTDFVVAECPGKTQNELYKKSIDWLAVTYKNPKEVLKAQIENEYIRIEGIKDGLVAGFMGSTFPIKYNLEISFKDNKYKFDVISIEYLVPANQYGTGGWKNYELQNVEDHYKKSGELKSKYENEHITFPKYFNGLNLDFMNFVKSDSIPSKKSDW